MPNINTPIKKYYNRSNIIAQISTSRLNQVNHHYSTKQLKYFRLVVHPQLQPRRTQFVILAPIIRHINLKKTRAESRYIIKKRNPGKNTQIQLPPTLAQQ